MNSLNILFAIIIGVTITILGGMKTYDIIHAHGFSGAIPIQGRTVVISNTTGDYSEFATRAMRFSDTFKMDFIMAGYSLNTVDWFLLIINDTNVKLNPFPMYDINTLHGNPFLVRSIVYFDCCEYAMCVCTDTVTIGPY